MSATIVMDAGTPTTGSLEVAAAAVITLSNFDDTGVLGWLWELLDKPAGSSSALSAANTATVTLTPDIPGTYVVQLKTYSDAARLVFDDADLQAAGVRFAGGYLWRLPGAGETTQFDSDQGWKVEVNALLVDIHDALLKLTATKIANYTATFGELVLVDLVTAAASVTITPPTAVGKHGKQIGMKIRGVAGAHSLIFNPLGSETVDAAATSTLSTDNAFAVYQSDNANWRRVG